MRIYLAAVLILAAACGDDAPASDAGPPDARVPGGTLSLSWTLSDGTQMLDCEDVAGVTVRIEAVPEGGANGTVESFTCTSGSGTSADLTPGVYDIEIDLRASGNRTLIAAPISVDNVTITLGVDTALPAAAFAVEPVGSFTFTVDADASGQNCGNGPGDADIVEIEFALADKDGACAEATFDVSGGQTYATSCTTPAPYPGGCIENNQQITVASTRSGRQTLTITGSQPGPVECWRRASQFTIPGNNLDADLMALLLALDFVPACDPNAPDAGS